MNLEDRLTRFVVWARGADHCRDLDAHFERAVLEDWAKLGTPIDFEAMNREIELQDERKAKERRERDEENARFNAEHPELMRIAGESWEDYAARTMPSSAIVRKRIQRGG